MKKTIKEKGIAGPGRGKRVGKAIVMQTDKKKPTPYPTMFMAQAATAQAKANDRANAKLPMTVKADRAMRKTEKHRKGKHLPLI